jgi:hypothetical protein
VTAHPARFLPFLSHSTAETRLGVGHPPALLPHADLDPSDATPEPDVLAAV